MPKITSAEKEARVNRKRYLRNKSVRSQVKTVISGAETLIVSGKAEAARAAVVSAISSLDRAAERGVLHPNNAARRKSRLTRKLNQATAQPSTQTKAE